jgi:hypothetical protein
MKQSIFMFTSMLREWFFKWSLFINIKKLYFRLQIARLVRVHRHVCVQGQGQGNRQGQGWGQGWGQGQRQRQGHGRGQGPGQGRPLQVK